MCGVCMEVATRRVVLCLDWRWWLGGGCAFVGFVGPFLAGRWHGWVMYGWLIGVSNGECCSAWSEVRAAARQGGVELLLVTA